MTQSKLSEAPGFQTSRSHPLIRDLGELRKRHGLIGTVLISFDSDSVGVNSSGSTDEFGAAMETLGDEILLAINNGQFDPKT